jgi:hypothetical protein
MALTRSVERRLRSTAPAQEYRLTTLGRFSCVASCGGRLIHALRLLGLQESAAPCRKPNRLVAPSPAGQALGNEGARPSSSSPPSVLIHVPRPGTRRASPLSIAASALNSCFRNWTTSKLSWSGEFRSSQQTVRHSAEWQGVQWAPLDARPPEPIGRCLKGHRPVRIPTRRWMPRRFVVRSSPKVDAQSRRFLQRCLVPAGACQRNSRR